MVPLRFLFDGGSPPFLLPMALGVSGRYGNLSLVEKYIQNRLVADFPMKLKTYRAGCMRWIFSMVRKTLIIHCLCFRRECRFVLPGDRPLSSRVTSPCCPDESGLLSGQCFSVVGRSRNNVPGIPPRVMLLPVNNY